MATSSHRKQNYTLGQAEQGRCMVFKMLNPDSDCSDDNQVSRYMVKVGKNACFSVFSVISTCTWLSQLATIG
jgi:hypothetical protein